MARDWDWIRSVYRMTEQDYWDLHARQDGRCARCGVEDLWLDIDHEPHTFTVRALLCSMCNIEVGNEEVLAGTRWPGVVFVEPVVR